MTPNPLIKKIHHDIFYKAINYWIEILINEIPLLGTFTKAFYFRSTFDNFRTQLILYQQLLLPPN